MGDRFGVEHKNNWSAEASMIRSLGFQTDLMLRSLEGQVLERDDYIVVRTPKNPTFRWGNFVIFRQAPRHGDFATWHEVFTHEIGQPPEVPHVLFGWDDPEGTQGEIEAFLAAGFRFDAFTVMTAYSVNPPPKLNTACMIRTFTTNQDWLEWIDLELAINNAQPEHERENDDGYRVYLERKAAEYQRHVQAGHGGWFGAYLKDASGHQQLAASLGLFVRDNVGRFQLVGTHPDFRRRGLCGTLVHHAALEGLGTMDANVLVMVADPEYVAASIYESVGFKPTEKQVALERKG
jgi:GNAT superfamily N-acetyltransferase